MRWVRVGTEARPEQEELSVTSCFRVEALRASGTVGLEAEVPGDHLRVHRP